MEKFLTCCLLASAMQWSVFVNGQSEDLNVPNNNINSEEKEKYSPKEFTEQIFLPVAPQNYHPEKTHESISVAPDVKIQNPIGQHNILDFSSYVFPPIKKSPSAPTAEKWRASHLNIDPSEFHLDRYTNGNSFSGDRFTYEPHQHQNYFTDDEFFRNGRFGAYRKPDFEVDHDKYKISNNDDDDEENDNDEENDEDEDEEKDDKSGKYQKDDNEEDEGDDEEEDDEEEETTQPPPPTSASPSPKYIKFNYALPQTTTTPYPPVEIIYTTPKPHFNLVAEKLKLQRLEAHKNKPNPSPPQTFNQQFYPTIQPPVNELKQHFEIIDPNDYIEPINYAQVDNLVQKYNPEGYKNLQAVNHHPTPVNLYQQDTYFGQLQPLKLQGTTKRPQPASDLNIRVHHYPGQVNFHTNHEEAEPYPKSEDRAHFKSSNNDKYRNQNVEFHGSTSSDYIPRAEYQLFQTFKRKRDLVPNTDPINSTIPASAGRYSSQYTDAFNDYGVQIEQPHIDKRDGSPSSSNRDYVTVDQKSTEAPPPQSNQHNDDGEVGPDGRKVLKEIKYFQDFFTAQMTPHELEFGHICEDPKGWEERYELKNLKDNRHQGKDVHSAGAGRGNKDHLIEQHEFGDRKNGKFQKRVRWGDKKGGYGEHYWDLNHHAASDQQGEKGNGNESTGNSGEKSAK